MFTDTAAVLREQSTFLLKAILDITSHVVSLCLPLPAVLVL